MPRTKINTGDYSGVGAKQPGEGSSHYEIPDWIRPDSKEQIRKTRTAKAESAKANPATSDDANGRRVVARSLVGIAPEKVEWLWDGLVPLGELTLLAGRQGIGKSTLAGGHIAADVSRGRLPGALQGTPANVLVIASEDSLTHTIVPRLLAAGADMRRVKVVEVERSGGLVGVPDLVSDIKGLAELIRQTNARLVVIDPLMSRMRGKDTHKDDQVREALEPLVRVAQENDCSVLALIHVNKSGSTDPLNLVMGSVAFTAVARSVLFLATDPEDEQTKMLGHIKSNLGPRQRGTRTFTLAPVFVKGADGELIEVSQVVWGERNAKSVEEILTEAQAGPRTSTVAERAAEWLVEHLTRLGGSQERSALIDDAAAEEWSEHQIKRGFDRLRLSREIVTERAEEFQGKSTWRLIHGGAPQ